MSLQLCNACAKAYGATQPIGADPGITYICNVCHAPLRRLKTGDLDGKTMEFDALEAAFQDEADR